MTTYSYTQTQTRSFTITEARYVASKIATDLNLLNSYYSKPSIENASMYAEEVALFVAKKYLNSVEFGFERNGQVIFSLKYTARSDGTLTTDDRPGRIPANLNMTGVTFYTYLRPSALYHNLTTAEKDAFDKTLPFQRASGKEPVLQSNGYWERTHSYSKNGEGVEREVFRQQG